MAVAVWSWDAGCVHCEGYCSTGRVRLVASCWSLSLHPTFMMHGHKSLKHPTVEAVFFSMLSLPSEFRCCPCFVYRFLSLKKSIIATSPNPSNLLCSFLINFSTSLLTNELLIKSYLCGALIRIMLAWFAFVADSNRCFIPTVKLFLAMLLEPAHNTTTSFFVNCWTFTLDMSFMYFIPAPGLTNLSTSKSLFNRWVTSEAHPLAWLSPKKITLCCFFPTTLFYDPSYASLLAWTLPSLIFLYLLGYRLLLKHYTKGYNDSMIVGMCV